MPHPAVTFRQATSVDLDGLLALQDLSLRSLTAADYPTGQIEQFIRDMDMITADLLSEGHFFVGTDAKGQITVCGGWSQAAPGYAHGFDAAIPIQSDHEAIVRAMFVRPENARQGLGRRMMEHIETNARAHGIRRLTLTATRTGLPLYRACGFINETPVQLDLSDGTRILGFDMDKSLVPIPDQSALDVVERVA